MSRGYLVVEGHGDREAALNLVTRLWLDLALPALHWAPALRGRNLHQERGVERACEYVRQQGDCSALLLLRDEDDACPKTTAPLAAAWIRGLRLAFPSAVVLAHREYESLFLPCMDRIAGRSLVDPNGVERTGVAAATSFEGDPQAVRGVKEWLSARMAAGRAYKPTVDQLPMTRLVDFPSVRQHQPPLPWFGSLERGLQFLAGEIAARSFGVYPPCERAPIAAGV